MRKSQTIRVGGQRIKVVLLPPSKMRCWGEADSAANLIKIRNDLSPERRVDTFFHELTHLLMAGHEEEIAKGDGEEIVCDAVGSWLTSLLAQNPAFVKQMIFDLE